MVLMLPWQDDNALFFKLAHISDAAGYLGRGLLGEGPYKYTAFWYYPIYKFFGFNTYAYFAYTLFLYGLATLVVYKVFSEVLGKPVGKLAGFLFACGYVASDGFIRLYNSAATSLSIILIAFILYTYEKLKKEKRLLWYLSALAAYWLAVETARYRNHYLIAIPFLLEVGVFLSSKYGLKKKIIGLVLRLTPFFAIFRYYFLVTGDSRSSQVKEFLLSFGRGEWYRLYGFLATVTNLVILDWLTRFLDGFTRPYLVTVILLLIVGLAVLILNPKKRRWIGLGGLFIGGWIIISRKIFINPVLNLSSFELVKTLLGGLLIVLFILGNRWISTKRRFLYFLLGGWALINLIAYSAYMPTVVYETQNRFLAHSFFALVGLLALLVENKKKWFLPVVFWGLGNLLFSIKTQNNILKTRIFPVVSFYQQLKNAVPNLSKGDVLYIDVADNMRVPFSHAFSVAQMPEETALAWRYGVDRYDIRLVTTYDDLQKLLKIGFITDTDNQPIKMGNIYTFFYSDKGLINTTDLFNHGSQVRGVNFKVLTNDGKTAITFFEPLVSVLPTTLNLTLSGTLKKFEPSGLVTIDKKTQDLAFDYQRAKKTFLGSSVKTTNYWRDYVPKNLNDGRLDTAWQADRVLWDQAGVDGGAVMAFKLQRKLDINRLVWVNAFANNSPTEYVIEVSGDGIFWKEAKKVNSQRRLESGEMKIEEFAQLETQFIRMRITKTLNNDSPGVAEVWVVPSEYEDLDIVMAEKYLKAPLDYVSDEIRYKEILSQMKYQGSVKYFWRNNKTNSYVSTDANWFALTFNGVDTSVEIDIPAGGTATDSLILESVEIPGNVEIFQIKL